MREKRTIRACLQAIHTAATDKAADVMTHPTWNLDYSFPFTLTVAELRQIDAYLKRTIPKPKRKVGPMLCR